MTTKKRRKHRRSTRRARSSAPRPKRRSLHRKAPRKLHVRRQSALSGALPLLGDTSPAGRRKLRLAQKMGLRVR
jgi:hypothetical protein